MGVKHWIFINYPMFFYPFFILMDYWICIYDIGKWLANHLIGMYFWGRGRQVCVKYSCTSNFMCEVRGCNYKTQRRYGYEHIADAAGKLFKVL